MEKILYVFGGEKASGAEIVVDRLMRYNQNHVEPHLIIAPGNYADKLLTENPYTITVSKNLKKLNRAYTGSLLFVAKAIINCLKLSFTVLRYNKKNKIKIVHANTVVTATYLIPAIIISKLLFLKTKWLWSDHDLSYFSKQDNLFANLNLKLYSITLAVSEAVKNKYRDTRSMCKVKILYNGLDIKHFTPDKDQRINFRRKYLKGRDSKVVIGIAGVLSLRKGQLSLLKCIIDNEWHLANTHLIMAGATTEEDNEYSDSLLALIKKHPNLVTYIGPISDMSSFYNGCDIIVSNSNIIGSEPLGTTIYEAMACEKIVVASNTGGTLEIIDNNKNGFIFEAENYDELSKLLIYSVNNVNSLRRMQTLAREKTASKFNISIMATNYNALIDAAKIR